MSFLLDREVEGLEGFYSFLADTPTIALRALRVHVGDSLPLLRQTSPFRGGVVEIGQTRIIEPKDDFTIVGGPYTTYPAKGFFTVIHPAATVGSIDPAIATRLACNNFEGIPINRHHLVPAQLDLVG